MSLGDDTADLPPAAAARRQVVVAPFARALMLLEAWSPQTCWLGNAELSTLTGLPASTVTRLTQTLVGLGYLHHSPKQHKYRLTAAVMALGYGAIANSRARFLPSARSGRVCRM